MRGWKKSERASGRSLYSCLLVVCLLLQSRPGLADTHGINIRDVIGTMVENTYMINATIDYQLSAEAEKALSHGVPLQFDTAISVKKHRRWLWDQSISSVILKYRLQYHPLSGYYLVTNMQNGERQQFQSLADIMAYLGKLKNYPLITRTAFGAGAGEYYGQISVKLDIKSLPAPLRPLAYMSAQWRLASPTYAWSIHL